MTEDALVAVLRRDRTIVAASLVALSTIAWAYVLWLMDSMRMGGMEMPDMRMGANPLDVVMIPSWQPWSVVESVFVFMMWAFMMVGMMTPSAAPMILIYARVGRQAELQGKPLAATGYFAAGYLIAWAIFSIFATTGQWLIERASLLTPMMQSASRIIGGLVLVAAGLYQWTPIKDACLKNCQAPLLFIQRHGGFRRDALGRLFATPRISARLVLCRLLLGSDGLVVRWRDHERAVDRRNRHICPGRKDRPIWPPALAYRRGSAHYGRGLADRYIRKLRMSALGHKRTFAPQKVMSALPQ
jgi:predicted metal-binding membrane protein